MRERGSSSGRIRGLMVSGASAVVVLGTLMIASLGAVQPVAAAPPPRVKSSRKEISNSSVVAPSSVHSFLIPHVTGGTITGTVTDSSGTGLSGICVDATPSGGGSGAFSSTGSGGTYSVTGLPTGSYTVEFTGNCGTTGSYLNQWYNGASTSGAATPVSVTSGSTTSSINATMVAAGTITGTVTDSGGTGISGICVDVTNPNGGNSGFSATGSGGTYSVKGIAT
ncbi:MAG: carboxypeptidase-like regulatory domain-containing protein, partial [Actinobacteria bacterium]|nr:carboxypeptidase-like regulatory domain-containing protein [Actinomycetota bacterium]